MEPTVVDGLRALRKIGWPVRKLLNGAKSYAFSQYVPKRKLARTDLRFNPVKHGRLGIIHLIDKPGHIYITDILQALGIDGETAQWIEDHILFDHIVDRRMGMQQQFDEYRLAEVRRFLTGDEK